MTGDEAWEGVAETSRESRLERLYRLHATRAKRLAFLLLGDEAEADDVVHDAFLRVARRFADMRSPEDFPAYLRVTILNLCRKRFRSASRRRSAYLRSMPAAAPLDDDLAGALAVRAALEGLTPRQRAAVVLRYYEDLSERQIAEVLGCRPGTVKSLLSRAIESMRGEVER